MAVSANGAAGWGMPPMGSASTPSAMNGWGLGQFGTPSQSTTPLSPQQTQQIQSTTAAMQQPMPQYTAPAASPQQTAMLQGLMGSGGGGQYLPSGSSIPGAVGPTSVNGMPLNPMGPTSVGGMPLG